MNLLKKKKLILSIGLLTTMILGMSVFLQGAKSIGLTGQSREGESDLPEASLERELTSEEYTISELYNLICRVDPETDIEEFKQKFNIGSDLIHIYKDDTLQEEVSSGNIGTGMALTYEKQVPKVPEDDDVEPSLEPSQEPHELQRQDEVMEDDDVETIESDKYIISVIGDTNGDGIIEQLELIKLIRYVVDRTNYDLPTLSFLSVDMNMDGKLDIIDITIMIRYITFDTMEKVEEKLPKKPIIHLEEVVENEVEDVQDHIDNADEALQDDVVEETEEEKWYKSDVLLSLESDKTSPVAILKNIYGITGAIVQENQELAEGEKVKLTTEGISEITAYSYSAYGIKSENTVEKVRIDKQVPTMDEIRVEGEEANTVNIVVPNIQDALSGVSQISITQSEQDYEWEDLTEENLIEKTFTKAVGKNGIWYVAVKDKAGNIASQTTEVTNVKEKVNNVEIRLQEIIGINEILPININYLGEPKSITLNIEDTQYLVLDSDSNRSEEVKDESERVIGYKKVYGIKGVKQGTVELEIVIEDYDGTKLTKNYNIIVVDKENSVALVGKMYYPTITSAIESIDKEGTVIILKSVAESFSIPAEKIITLEIGEFLITGRINNDGNLTIASGSVTNTDETIYNEGTVLMQNGTVSSTNNIAIHNLAHASVTIENGEITSQTNNAILNYGDIIVKNANIKTDAPLEEAILNRGEANLTILNGTVEAKNNIAIKNEGALTIGTEDDNVDVTTPVITGKDFGVYTTGTFNWFDGNITANEIMYGKPTKLPEEYLINEEIKEDGTRTGTLVTPKFGANGKKYVLLSEAIQVTPIGGTVTLLQDAVDSSTVEINKQVVLDLNEFTLTRNKEIKVKESGNLLVKNGTLEAPESIAITAYMGRIQVQDAVITGKESAISQSTNSTTHIISGTVIGTKYGIKSMTQENTIILGDNSNAIKLEDPIIIGEEFAIYADEKTQVNYYSGKLQGKTNPGYYIKKATTFREGYIITTTVENEYYTSTLISNSEFKVYIRREGSEEYYRSIKEAISYADAQKLNSTISFMRNITEDLTIPETANITLAMGEYTLTGKILNKGTLTIANGKLANSDSTTIYNSNKLYVDGGTIESVAPHSATIYNEAKANMTMRNGKIISVNYNAVINCGTLEVEDGEIVNQSETNSCIVTNSEATTIIKDGSIKSEKYTAIQGETNSTITIGNNEDKLTAIELPEITGKQYGINTQGTLNYYDGKVTAGVAIQSNVTNPLDQYSVYTKNYNSKSGTYQVAILIPINNVAKIGEDVYGSLEEAIKKAEEKQTAQEGAVTELTIEILRDIKESVVIPDKTKIILDIGNYTVTGRISNKGTLTITSGKVEHDEQGAIYNEGILTITKATVKGTAEGSPTVFNASEGRMNILGGEVRSEYNTAIKNKGSLTITNSDTYIHSNSKDYATILNETNAYLTISAGRITNHAQGKAIDGDGIKLIVDGVIEPPVAE